MYEFEKLLRDMNGLVRIGENPFAKLEMPRRPTTERGAMASLEAPWRSSADLEAALASLPADVREILGEVPAPAGTENPDRPLRGSVDDMVEGALEMSDQGLKAVFGDKLGYFMSSKLKLADQLAERLRRKEDRGALVQELVAEMDRLYSGHRAPFASSEYLESRRQDAIGKIKEINDHLERHASDLRQRREAAEPYLNKPGYLAPYERELIKKYRSLRQFLGSDERDAIHDKGHRDDLRIQRSEVAELLKDLSEQRDYASFLEMAMSRSAGRLAPEDFADVWLRATDWVQPVNPIKIRYLRNVGYEVEAKAAEDTAAKIQSLMFDAALAWLGKHEREARPSKSIGVLARRFNEARAYLESAKREPESLAASLQHAQIILRRLVQLLEKG